MRILLDENFPIQLYRRLQERGHAAEHIIALGLRGLPDAEIRLRLAVEADLVFLTQDTEFAELPAGTAATVMISRIPPSHPDRPARRAVAPGDRRRLPPPTPEKLWRCFPTAEWRHGGSTTCRGLAHLGPGGTDRSSRH